MMKYLFWKIFKARMILWGEERRDEKKDCPPVTWYLGYVVEHGRPLRNLEG